ncbi:MAG: class I SAM-dependent methyltransferase [Microbacteriaceae bacterium]
MSTANAYESLAARVYELDKPTGHSFGDIEFYAELLDGCTGPILEPAVGSGRFLIPMLQRGFMVSGTDPSEHMLAICEREAARAGVRARLAVAAFGEQAWPERYEAIVVPAGSIQLIATFDETREALRKMLSQLAPGGRLVLDLDSLAGLAEPAGPARSWQDGAHTLTLVSSIEERDFSAQRLTQQLRYERWNGPVLEQQELQRFTLRFWGVEEMRLLLEGLGAETVTVHADYVFGAQPTEATSVTTLVATLA